MIKVEVVEIGGNPRNPELQKGELIFLQDEDWEDLNEDEKGKYILTAEENRFVKYYLRSVVE